MSATAAPFGLRPVFHPSGTIRPTEGLIASGYANNIYQYSPVGIAAAGTLIQAAAGATPMGTFMGVEYTPTDGRRRYGNAWPAAQVATQIVAYYTRDPEIIYEIQCNATLALASIGDEFNWTSNGTNDGNITTGLSTVSLDVASVAANANMQVLQFAPYIDNLAGDAFPIVQVKLSLHQMRPVYAFVPTV